MGAIVFRQRIRVEEIRLVVREWDAGRPPLCGSHRGCAEKARRVTQLGSRLDCNPESTAQGWGPACDSVTPAVTGQAKRCLTPRQSHACRPLKSGRISRTGACKELGFGERLL